MSTENNTGIELECTIEIKSRNKRLSSMFDYKTEEAMEREVTPTNQRNFRAVITSLLDNANELVFITKGDAHTYAKEIFTNIQKIFSEGNMAIANGVTNADINDIIAKKSNEIGEYVYLIENNEDAYKDFVFEGDVGFDENHFVEVAKKLKLVNKSEDNKMKLYQEELNGGATMLEVSRVIGLDEDEEVVLYGADKDIKKGNDSMDRGIRTARGGLLSVSNFWADLTITTNKKLVFSRPRDERGIKVSSTPLAYERTLNRRVMKRGSIFMFNAPFYKIPRVRRDIEEMEIVSILDTGDVYGNLVFVVKQNYPRSSSSMNLLSRAQFSPQSLPKELKEEVVVELENVSVTSSGKNPTQQTLPYP